MAPIKRDVIERIKDKTEYIDECWIYTGQPSKIKEYDAPVIRDNYGINEALGAVAYKKLIGPIPKGKIVCHTCNKARCWNPKHLYAGTWQSNMNDKVISGRATSTRGMIYNRGISNQNCKISEQTAKLIKSLLHENISVETICTRLDLTYNTVYDIKRGRSWAWL